jgi:hypothetical protein
LSDRINAETLNFIYDYTKGAPEEQFKDVEALDSKMIQVFSAASVIIGLGGLSQSGGGLAAALFILLAVGAYVGVGIAAFQHLRPRNLRRSLQADVMWRMAWQLKVPDIKHSVIKDVAAAYTYNKGVVTDKGSTLQRALFWITTEVVLVGAALVAARLG